MSSISMSTLNYDYLLKIVVVGDSSTGKSSLVKRISENKFDPTYLSTIGVDFAIFEHKLNSGQLAKVQLWDTSGHLSFRSITQSYYRGAHIILLTIDVTMIESYESCMTWLQDIKHWMFEGTEIVILANKIDNYKQRIISDHQLNDLQEQTQLPLYRVSAKTGDQVDKVIHSVIEEYVKNHFERAKIKSNLEINPSIKLQEKTSLVCKPQKTCC